MSVPRVRLACLPTPLHRLDRLSDNLNVDLWIKRDDLTGFAAGGNKGRKIEFLIADALQSGADAVVCQGAKQSNFIRQLGAACAMFGLECHAVVMRLPYYAAAGPAPSGHDSDNGNVLLDALFGVQFHAFPDGDWDELDARAHEVADELKRSGKRPFFVKIGGSSPGGAYSFVLAGDEIVATGETFDWIVTASSSGSTHAGLAYRFHGTSTKVIGISADPDPDGELAADIADLCGTLNGLTGQNKTIVVSDIDLRMDYCGAAYGIPSAEGDAAMRRFAKREGIVLDPVYTAKAAAGLLDLIESGAIGGRTLFWHTGGLPTLFATD